MQSKKNKYAYYKRMKFNWSQIARCFSFLGCNLELRCVYNLRFEKIISIPKMSFKPREFFIEGRDDNGVDLWLTGNFKDIFLPLLSNKIEFNGIELEKLRLQKLSNDFDIQRKIGNQVQIPDAIAAEIKYFISKQSKGEKKDDLDSYISHLFYFEYMGRVWCVNLRWDSGSMQWSFGCRKASKKKNQEWNPNCVVFRVL